MHSRSIFDRLCRRCHRRLLPEVARECRARRLLVVYARSGQAKTTTCCTHVDGARAFVSSANFTQRGQDRNIEVGVLIEHRSFASYLAGQWLRLIDAGIVGEYRKCALPESVVRTAGPFVTSESQTA